MMKMKLLQFTNFKRRPQRLSFSFYKTYYERKGLEYMETLKNKIVAIILLILGLVSIQMLNESTVFVCLFLLATVLLIAKENVIGD